VTASQRVAAALTAAAVAGIAATTVTGCKSAADAVVPSAEAQGALVPCTSGTQTQCVKCDGSEKGVCTETEAALVRQDIAKHHVSKAGPEASEPGKVYPKEPCYECMMHSGCLDDVVFNEKGHECQDLAGGATSAAQCSQALKCMLSTGCARTAISTCYCGDAGVLACHASPVTAGGACAQAIATGLAFDKSDGVNVTSHLTDTSRPSGMAAQILQCAHSNSCTSCF
jgi:hypothetical protein